MKGEWHGCAVFQNTPYGIQIKDVNMTKTTCRRVESMGRVFSFPPIFLSSLASHHDVKTACCVFDCLCLCVGWMGVLLLSVWWCPLLRCLTSNEFVKQSVKITTAFKSFTGKWVQIISYPYFYSKVPFCNLLQLTSSMLHPQTVYETMASWAQTCRHLPALFGPFVYL